MNVFKIILIFSIVLALSLGTPLMLQAQGKVTITMTGGAVGQELKLIQDLRLLMVSIEDPRSRMRDFE